MKIETRTDALIQCFNLWLWAGVTGIERKCDWPGWKSNGGYLEYCSAWCPICEYSNCCAVCIIKWSNGSCDNSEFYEWAYAETKQERIKWALKIAALALDAL